LLHLLSSPSPKKRIAAAARPSAGGTARLENRPTCPPSHHSLGALQAPSVRDPPSSVNHCNVSPFSTPLSLSAIPLPSPPLILRLCHRTLARLLSSDASPFSFPSLPLPAFSRPFITSNGPPSATASASFLLLLIGNTLQSSLFLSTACFCPLRVSWHAGLATRFPGRAVEKSSALRLSRSSRSSSHHAHLTRVVPPNHGSFGTSAPLFLSSAPLSCPISHFTDARSLAGCLMAL
jgi:hypothetical protein